MEFLIFALIAIFVLLFILCTVFFPELVGIAGKKAKEIEESHHRDQSETE